ncbi:aspartic peptidase domain-containing protein [Scleroderma yunnanense]
MPNIVINSVPFATRLRIEAYGAKELIQRDRARIASMLSGRVTDSAVTLTMNARKDSPTVDVTDNGIVYTMSVGVGQPPTEYTLLVDTGSAITWVGAKKKYNPTSTSHDTGDSVDASYGFGSMSGKLYIDTVTLSPGLVVKKQSIGVARTAQGIRDVDGIIGLGPVDLTRGTVTGGREVPTVTDNLFSEGIIPSDSLGIFYAPLTKVGETTGEITFGGIDDSKITSEINYVPLTTTPPASFYWGIDQIVTYGKGISILGNASGFVDTGATFLFFIADAFNAYKEATGAYKDSTTGLLVITEAQYHALQSLFFHIGSVTYEFTPNAQIWPRALNSVLKGDSNKIYLVVVEIPSTGGIDGIRFVNGFSWLQRFYSVCDSTNGRIGFATTHYTNANTN